jgi:hypothetical protein
VLRNTRELTTLVRTDAGEDNVVLWYTRTSAIEEGGKALVACARLVFSVGLVTDRVK